MTKFVSTLLDISKIFLKYPKEIFNHLSIDNFKILLEAIKNEPKADILKNLLRKIGRYDGPDAPVVIIENTQLPTSAKSSVAGEGTKRVPEPIKTKFVFHVDQNLYYSNMLILQGWAFKTPIPLKNIEVYINGKLSNSVVYGFKRPDVEKLYEDSMSLQSGFYLQQYIDSFDSLNSIELVFIDFMGVKIVEKLNPPFKDLIPKPLPYNINKVYQYRLLEEYTTNQSFKNFDIKGPKISLVVPVYKIEVKWMKIAVDSIINQTYKNWELILVDDCSKTNKLRNYLESIKDERVKVLFLEKNGGISNATNQGIKKATGDFIAFMDHDDKLALNAFEEIVLAYLEDPTIDLIYTDEDKINTKEKRLSPVYKPDWSPHLIFATNYFNHLLCIKSDIVRKEKFNSDFDGCQDWHFILRIIKHVKNIHHIPKVLYHWRTLEGSISGDGNSKEVGFSFFKRCENVINDHLKSISPNLTASRPDFAINMGAALFELDWSKFESRSICCIIHITDLRLGVLLLQKLNSIVDFEIENILICESHIFEKITETSTSLTNISITHIDSNLNQRSLTKNYNFAVSKSKSDDILFLDEKVHNLTSQWMRNVLGALYLNEVGAATSKVLDSNNNIYSTGVLCGLFTEQFEFNPVDAFKGKPMEDIGYFFFSHIIRNYSTLPPYVLAIKKEIFNEIGGFDDAYTSAYFVEDMCLRLTEHGKYNVFLPDHVSIFDTPKDKIEVEEFEDVLRFIHKYKKFEDPFYNKNLSRYNLFEVDHISNRPKQISDVKSRKILVCTHNLNLEGAPIQIYEIVKGLKELHGYSNIDVISPLEGELRNWYTKIGVNVIVNSGYPLFNTKATESVYKRHVTSIANWMESLQYDMVIANTLLTFYWLEAAKSKKICTMWVIHESAPITELVPAVGYNIKAKIAALLPLVNRVVFSTKRTEALYDGYKQHNNFSILNLGIETEHIDSFIENNDKEELRAKYDIKPEQKVFLSVGSFTERKGQLDLVRAAINSIKSGNYNGYYILVGAKGNSAELSYENKIQRLIQSNSVQTYFEIIGETEDILTYYQMADVFVCNSYNESYPRVTLMAMRFNLPIITTPVFGLADQVKDGINASLYNPSEINELQGHIDELILNTEQIEEMSSNSRKVLSLINTYDEMIEKYHEEIDFLI